MIFAVIVGASSRSWGIGIGTLLLLIILAAAAARASEPVSRAIGYLVGVVWGISAFAITFAADASPITVIMVTVLFGLIGAAMHVTAFQHIRDIQRSRL
jgi:heme/copper-type cytochrome/quinol oxidase subunit 4